MKKYELRYAKLHLSIIHVVAINIENYSTGRFASESSDEMY